MKCLKRFRCCEKIKKQDKIIVLPYKLTVSEAWYEKEKVMGKEKETIKFRHLFLIK